MSKAAEEDITNQLFSTELNTTSAGLTSEKNYVDFARQVSDVLYEGQAPYHLPAFFNELTRELGKIDLKSEDIKKILNGVTILYNNKVQEEKKAQGGNKKAKANAKPGISQAKGMDNLRNNNPQMISDLTGDQNDDYDDEYGDYGDENDGSKRVPEEAYDFM